MTQLSCVLGCNRIFSESKNLARHKRTCLHVQRIRQIARDIRKDSGHMHALLSRLPKPLNRKHRLQVLLFVFEYLSRPLNRNFRQPLHMLTKPQEAYRQKSLLQNKMTRQTKKITQMRCIWRFWIQSWTSTMHLQYPVLREQGALDGTTDCHDALMTFFPNQLHSVKQTMKCDLCRVFFSLYGIALSQNPTRPLGSGETTLEGRHEIPTHRSRYPT